MPEPTKAAPHQRVTLARIAVGDQLMTTDPTGLRAGRDMRLIVEPHRFSDGTVREVAEVRTRKAAPHETPGRLITLVFTDGTTTDERYGTTSHYYAATFGAWRKDDPMSTRTLTGTQLSALAWVAGRPEAAEPPALVVLDLVDNAEPLIRSVPKPAGGAARDMFELTDAGRRELDAHSQRVAGWDTSTLKDLGDGKHWRWTSTSPKLHHFAGRAGDALVSACGSWKVPAGNWRVATWQQFDPEPPAGRQCARCRRELVRAG